MFGRNKKLRESAAVPPEGVQEFIICVYNDKRRVKHHFRSVGRGVQADERFRLLDEPGDAAQGGLLSEALSAGEPLFMSFSCGSGKSKQLHVLPYERKRMNYTVCVQAVLDQPDPDGAHPSYVNALHDGRAFFLLADEAEHILGVSPRIPEDLGYSAEDLREMRLHQLFGRADMRLLKSSSADTNKPALSCVLYGRDGVRLDVEIMKYTAPDGCMLLGIGDITRPQLNDEVAGVAARERRRIGQDLHDSIGQMLTGISLLSRSLANSLERSGSSDSGDAKQISELADDASNQIRQISRGLMPSEVVHRGLHASLRELAAFMTESCGLTCDAMLDDAVEINDGAVETHLFRIAQEAVNNAVRHSGGDRVVIYVSDVNGNPKLEISDNGQWRNILENQGGIGLKTMEYRASAINAQLNISRAETGGTCVTCQLEAEEYLETKVV